MTSAIWSVSWIKMERTTKIGNLCNLLNLPESWGKPRLSPSTVFYCEEHCANISLPSKLYNQMTQTTNRSQSFEHSGASSHVQPWMKPRWLISYTLMNVCSTWKRCLLSLYLCSPIKHYVNEQFFIHFQYKCSLPHCGKLDFQPKVGLWLY